MKTVKVEEAIGAVLAHDLTKVIPKDFTGAAYKKGYIIKEQDISLLKDMGKYHINIIELGTHEIHEDEAAARLGEACLGKGLYLTDAAEGKVQIKAAQAGLLKVNKEILMQINEVDEIILSTCHTHTVVTKDQLVAGTKVIPLTVAKSKIELIESICQNKPPVLEIIPLKPLKTGIVVTGSEVYYKRIEDKFGDVLKGKVEALGGTVINTLFAPDDKDMIIECIMRLLNDGADMIMVSGGMAVDADDVTPMAIKAAASNIVTYGSPVLPGAMFMLAYSDNNNKATQLAPILGIPACGMYRKITVLDIILPRLFAQEIITKKDIVAMAHGGFCYGCEECRYPICPMGKS